LGAVGTVLTASPGLDAQEAAELNALLFAPVGAVGFTRLFQEIKEGLPIYTRKLGKGFGCRTPQ
jgi:hypothetical protein